jgi:hypothetical protein
VSGHRSFRVLQDRTHANPERRKRARELREAYDALHRLAVLRESAGSARAGLAREMDLAELANRVAAPGGRLELRAVFPDRPDKDVFVVLPGRGLG